MRPDYEDGRYITLMGDPIGPNGPASPTDPRSLWKCPDIKVGGIATALCAAFNSVAGGTEYDVARATLTSIFGSILDIAIWRTLEKINLSFMGIKDTANDRKCIDTRPDPTTPVTLDRYGLAAHRLKNLSAGITAACGVMDLLACVSAFASTGSPVAVANSIAWNAAKYTRLIGVWNRFNKVSTGEWVIVDMPKPKETAVVELRTSGINI